jgi:S-adenosylmethionine-dependent methyltransferase
MDQTTKIVKEFYENNVESEWDRLQRHYIEFDINRNLMDKYIKPGDSVLDVGGGPGRYSLYFADRGCDVTLVDLSCANIEFAKKKANERGIQLKAFAGDARETDNFTHEQYDHILLMGPLYHLLEEADRVKAIEACIKLLKPGGILYAAFISSYANVIYYATEAPQLILKPECQADFMTFKEDKPFKGQAFTQVYFTKTGDVIPFMSRFALEKLHLISSESFLAPFELMLHDQPKAVNEAWIQLGIEVCEREDLLSYAQHLLYVGKKKI